ncbi:MAG TPA: carboxypeptidase-like regulatory domain-containing protein, partial [Candidatus Acidoferrum sp.]|nr:carboxypeptidase-like regulatory domain-containing protein [Candidatus Acidoferrum sp.]
MKQLLIALFLVLVFVLPANAQTFRGAINGTVTDPSGAVVPAAHVKTTNKATSIDYATESTSDGQFAFQDLPVGAYRVSVTAAGFPTLQVDNVMVAQGAIYTLAA